MSPSPTRHPGLVTTDVATAATRLLDGGLVAIPTETVYGLAAVADDVAAVERVFAVKERPPDHPLIVHVASVDHLDGWVAGWHDAGPGPHAARVLAAACWPGPLTLLVPRGPRVPDAVTGGRPTVGVRVPAHPLTTELLLAVGTGLAAPSANRFGRVSPTSARHVLDDLGERLDPTRDAVLDGGACPIGVESTIVDCTVTPPQVLRPGGIATDDIVGLLAEGLAPPSGPSRSPGMLTTHYSPRCVVELVDDRRAAEARVVAHTSAGEHADVLDGTSDLVGYARDLYAMLRAADDRGLDRLVAVLPPSAGLGHAIRDRLMRAAGRAGSSPPSRDR